MEKKAIELDENYLPGHVALVDEYTLLGMDREAEKMIKKAQGILKKQNK